MHPFIYMMKFTTVCDSRYGVLDIQHNTLITVRTLSIKVLPRLLTDVVAATKEPVIRSKPSERVSSVGYSEHIVNRLVGRWQHQRQSRFKSRKNWGARRQQSHSSTGRTPLRCTSRGMPSSPPSLTLKWDPTKKDFGFKNEGSVTATARIESCKLFMSHVASFLPEPFWNHRIMERSKCMEDIWETFNYIFSVETSAESFLDLALIEYNSTESHHCFLARIIYHIENNKCRPRRRLMALTQEKMVTPWTSPWWIWQ